MTTSQQVAMVYYRRCDDAVFPVARSRESMEVVIETSTDRIGTFWQQYVEGKAATNPGFAQFHPYLIR